MSAKKIVPSIDSVLWPNRYILNIMGFWIQKPDTSKIYKYFVVFRVVFSIVAIGFLLVPEIMLVIVFWGNIAILTEVGCVTMTLLQVMFKMFYVLVNRRRFSRVYTKICKLWSMSKQEYELRQGLQKLADQAKKYSIAFFVTCFCNNISFTTMSVIDWMDYNAQENKTSMERRLPFDVWLGFDLQRTPNFEIVFVAQSISAIFCCFGIVGLDTTLMTIILHICGHFRILGEKFRAVGRRIEEENRTGKRSQPGPNSSLSQCIRFHQKMINFAEETRILLSPIIFVQLLTSGLEICLSSYAVIVNNDSNNYGDLIRCIGYFFSIFVQLILWCWPGQLLIQDSTEIGHIVLHELPWWDMSVEEQHRLIFVIFRSQKACRITALDFQVMSMNKLTDVFNTAGSYLALLRRVYEKETD